MLSHAPYDRRTSYVVTLVGDSRSGISPNVMAAVADALSQAKVRGTPAVPLRPCAAGTPGR